jgi:hypothetical protein
MDTKLNIQALKIKKMTVVETSILTLTITMCMIMPVVDL